MVHYPYPNNLPVYDVIFYGRNYAAAKNPIYYDLRNVMRKYLSKDDFDTWDKVFQQAVVYSVHPRDIQETGIQDWMTDELYFSHFNSVEHSIMLIHHKLFIHFSVDGHSETVSAITNTTSMNIFMPHSCVLA
jgi:hypothetical protein